MLRKTFITSMPDKAGSFLRASEIISKFNGNIVRVSYNKAVDLHMLFIEVEAKPDDLQIIEEILCGIGYINDDIIEKQVIEVSIKIPDDPGAVVPVLKILNRFNINISYINSSATGEDYQDFKMGLL
jgi:ACT domain-containing protein